jgi:hypothetical protein
VCRFILICLGVYWIEEVYPAGRCCAQLGFLRGRNAPRIITPNHCSFIDALYIGARVIPVGVGKAGLGRAPIFGPMLLALRPILVPRTPKDRETLPDVVTSIKACVNANNPRYPPVVIFPYVAVFDHDCCCCCCCCCSCRGCCTHSVSSCQPLILLVALIW